MKKNYVSNSEESIKLFKSNLFNNLSKVHYTVPLYIFIPAILFIAYKAFSYGVSLTDFAIYFVGGLII